MRCVCEPPSVDPSVDKDTAVVVMDVKEHNATLKWPCVNAGAGTPLVEYRVRQAQVRAVK